MSRCPCCSGKSYEQCCQPLHEKKTLAKTAEQLMRARYSAYALRRQIFVWKSWHPDYRPVDIELDIETHWLGLRIISTQAGTISDNQGMVHFKAYYKVEDKPGVMEERSQFLKIDNNWLYLNGEMIDSKIKISRNDPCLCGSGKKYKKCCA